MANLGLNVCVTLELYGDKADLTRIAQSAVARGCLVEWRPVEELHHLAVALPDHVFWPDAEATVNAILEVANEGAPMPAAV